MSHTHDHLAAPRLPTPPIDRIACQCIHPGMGVRTYFKDARLVRMSNGDYCIIRDLGLVRGGKGMRHHDNLLRLTPGGLLVKAVGLLGTLRVRRERLSRQ